MKLLFLVVAAWILIPVAVSFARYSAPEWSWSSAPRQSSGLAPDPRASREAIVQIYLARAFAWRGIFATHPWIIVKRTGATSYTRHEVVGWGAGPKLRTNYAGADGLWYGAKPELLVDLRGLGVDALIDRIEGAVASYPFKDVYRTWPGPNSNTFLAHIGREVPELSLDIPASAVGKDYRPWYQPIGRAPSGTGVQLSILGLAGATLAPEEGIEFNLLGLSFGLDLLQPALRLPAFGRIGMAEDSPELTQQ
ncbi:MAG: DUF3750 domain-containing protein [Dongiaceae bacterium]